jgi:hypothetical protein
MRMLRSGAALLVLSLLLCSSGCSDEETAPPVGPDTPDAGSADAGGGGAEGGGAEGGEAGGACSTLALAPPPVAIDLAREDPPPPAGGALRDGTYVTTRAVLYVGAATDVAAPTDPIAVTVRITGTFAETFVDGLARTASLATAGTTLTSTGICPGTKVEEVGYTATSDRLEIHVRRSKGTLVETFVRQ